MEESTDKRWRGLSEGARAKLKLRNYGEKLARAGEFLDREQPIPIPIRGVELIHRTIYQQNHRGFFGELAREGEIGFWPRQWSTARMFAESAKGFHIHPPHIPDGEEPESWFQKLFVENGGDRSLRPYSEEQWDVMFFIQGIAEMILIDERSGMPRAEMRFLIDGDDRPGPDNVAVVIPPGVAHAIRSASSADLIMVYGTSTTFDPVNEGRIASDLETRELPDDWKEYMA